MNPPGFYWTPNEQASGYRLEVRKADEPSRTVVYAESLRVYPMWERMSLGWDWIDDKLTPEERQKALASMTERGKRGHTTGYSSTGLISVREGAARLAARLISAGGLTGEGRFVRFEYEPRGCAATPA